MHRIHRTIGAVMAAGALAAVAAAPASAAPFDLFKVNPVSGATHFGGDCVNGGLPVSDAVLDWNEDLAAGTVEPQVTGVICLGAPSNGIETQVRLDYYNLALPGPHADEIVASRSGRVKTGTGAPNPNQFNVNVGGLPFNSNTVHHVHVVLRDNRSGTMEDVGVAALDYP